MNQRFAARLAGFLFLWLIVTGVAGMMLIGNVTGSGTFAEKAARVVASEHLYRLGLCLELIETISALVLGFALYVVLKPVDDALARFGVAWRVAESILGAVGITLGFLKLRVYTAGLSEGLLDALRRTGQASTSIGAIFFSIGSLVFFYLFWKSPYIPRWLSGLGIVASLIVACMCFGLLIFPEHGSRLQYGWAPMAVAEVVTGIWLMVGKRFQRELLP